MTPTARNAGAKVAAHAESVMANNERESFGVIALNSFEDCKALKCMRIFGMGSRKRRDPDASYLNVA